MVLVSGMRAFKVAIHIVMCSLLYFLLKADSCASWHKLFVVSNDQVIANQCKRDHWEESSVHEVSENLLVDKCTHSDHGCSIDRTERER